MPQSTKPTRPLLLMLASSVLLAQYGVAAEARDARAQHASQRGHADYTRQTQVQRTGTGHTRSDTWTNAQGKTASRNATVVNDKGSGTRTRDVRWQGPQGQQATRHDFTQRTDDGYTRSTTATNARVGRPPAMSLRATIRRASSGRGKSTSITTTGADSDPRVARAPGVSPTDSPGEVPAEPDGR